MKCGVAASRFRLSDETELMPHLIQLARDWVGPVSILAGHFVVAYRNTTHELVPVLPTYLAPGATGDELDLLSAVGNFADYSFRLGLEFYDHLRVRSVHSRILLLANDSLFTSSRFQGDTPMGHALGHLRRDFYCRHPHIPRDFAEHIGERRVEDVFEPNDDSDRQAGSLLPTHTWLYSEAELRNAFAKHRREWLLAHPGFSEGGGAIAGKRIFFDSPIDGGAVCVTDEAGRCGCSGEALELMVRLHEKGYENLVWFIPAECRVPAEGAIGAAMESLGLAKNVIVFWGDICGKDGAMPLHSIRSGTHFRMDI